MNDFNRQKLDVMIKGIQPLDEESRGECYSRWDDIAKPIRGLGRLEDIIAQIAGIEHTPDVRTDRKALVIFCADNGIVDEGVTQTGSNVTVTVADDLAKGIASANVMAALADADVIPIDIGVAGEAAAPGIMDAKISPGTADFLKGPAMNASDAVQAILTGIDIASRMKDMGYDLVAAGEMGIGNTTTSAAVAAVMLDLTPEEAAGRGAGLSDEGLARKTEVIREGMELHHPDKNDPINVLAALGGLDIAGICGLMLGGAIYGLPIIMDGLVSCAAALLATAMAPAVRDYLIPSHEGREPVCHKAMQALGMDPVIHADLALGEGTGALLLLPMIDMAAAVYRKAATFEEINVIPYKHL